MAADSKSKYDHTFLILILPQPLSYLDELVNAPEYAYTEMQKRPIKLPLLVATLRSPYNHTHI